MSKTLVNIYNIAYEYRMRINVVLIASCLLMISVYAFSIFRTIARTVALQKLNSEIASVSSSVKDLDTRYMEITSTITPDSLRSHGFSVGQVSQYISRTASLGRVAIGAYEL